MPKLLTEFNNGEVALVTAGASGIGRCIAETLLDHGVAVHVCDQSAEALQNFLQAHPEASGSLTDVADASQVELMIAELDSRHHRLDILVNNAGISGPTAAVDDISVEDWDRTISVDLSAHFYVTRAAVPFLRRRKKGAIINISSNAAFFGFPLRSAYTAAKWGMIGLTKTWAMELGPVGIRVNAICPGSVNGARIEGVIARDAAARGVTPDEIKAVYARQSSMRCFVDAQDVANMAVFLASDLGVNVSGQALGIDGHTEGLSNWLE
jgi:NAD(P)-dependent dehydrogenase (short-subunit alcohol dehydrogenase family)